MKTTVLFIVLALSASYAKEEAKKDKRGVAGEGLHGTQDQVTGHSEDLGAHYTKDSYGYQIQELGGHEINFHSHPHEYFIPIVHNGGHKDSSEKKAQSYGHGHETAQSHTSFNLGSIAQGKGKIETEHKDEPKKVTSYEVKITHDVPKKEETHKAQEVSHKGQSTHAHLELAPEVSYEGHHLGQSTHTHLELAPEVSHEGHHLGQSTHAHLELVPESHEETTGSHKHEIDLGTHTHTHITITKKVGIPVLQPYPVHIEKKIPVPVPHPVPVYVDKPYPVHVIKPYPVLVEKAVPYPVVKHIAVPVKVEVKVPVKVPVAVPVPKPYPVLVHKKVFVAVPEPVIVEKKFPVVVKVEKHSEDSNAKGMHY